MPAGIGKLNYSQITRLTKLNFVKNILSHKLYRVVFRKNNRITPELHITTNFLFYYLCLYSVIN